jgi:hypothetical protein
VNSDRRKALISKRIFGQIGAACRKHGAAFSRRFYPSRSSPDLHLPISLSTYQRPGNQPALPAKPGVASLLFGPYLLQ